MLRSDTAKENKRERDRKRSEAKRRENGVAPVKGTTIRCSTCNAAFTRKAARTVRCKPCQRAHYLADARAHSERMRIAKGYRKVGDAAVCSRCMASFQITAGKQKHCEPCRALPDSKRWAAVVTGQKVSAAAYRKRNPERVSQLERAKRERRKVNPAFTINERMSAGVRQSLVLGKQGWRWEKLVGYTLADLMRHLERQFLPGMTWENRGEWHLDHIQPLSSFQFDTHDHPDFRAAWALANLRPLWALENISKNDRRTHLL